MVDPFELPPKEDTLKGVNPTKSWINTYTGTQFWPLEPRIEDVFIVDIVHALSNLCRYSGHVKRFYSVCEHSILVGLGVEVLGGTKLEVLEGFLHDATEAYLVDIPSPIKRSSGLGSEYRKVEARLNSVIRERFGLPQAESEIVKLVDKSMIAVEAPRLFNNLNPNWTHEPVPEKLEVFFNGWRGGFGLDPGVAKGKMMSKLKWYGL